GEVGKESELLNEIPAGRGTALDFEYYHGPAFSPQVTLAFLELRIGLKTGETHPLDFLVGLEIVRDVEGVLTMALHPQGQRLDALKQEPGVVRRNAGPEIA